jgi:hypothetical protein
MATINIGDRVEITGDTQHFILKDPNRVYTGEVIGKYEGQLLVRLDEPIGHGPAPSEKSAWRRKMPA